MNLCLPILLLAVSPVADPPKKDLDKIQGTWTVSRMEISGELQPKDTLFTVKVTFDHDRILAQVGKRRPEPRGTVKLGQTQEPKAYDLVTSEGLTVLGIYALEGDTLKVCLSSPDEERPTTFETSPDDGRTLITYQREKSSKPR